MTSFAFILGVVPLLITHGAGAEMRRVLGVAVFSGMLGVTVFGIFLTPVFFYVIAGFARSELTSTVEVRFTRMISIYTLRVLTLGIPWLIMELMGRRRWFVQTEIPDTVLAEKVVVGTEETNGNGKPHEDNGELANAVVSGEREQTP
jgi:hypothetical protein